MPAFQQLTEAQRLCLFYQFGVQVHPVVSYGLLHPPTASRKLTLDRLIRDGSAIPFTAHATSPTVTMPRIKAITTGSIPSFLDVILNIDEGDESSSLASQDTWLAQMKAKNTGKLLLYGDDTWIKLFPGLFDRADGTSSFFVAVWSCNTSRTGRPAC